ncbi:hypothetical protein G4B88_007775 [Cannabis sativa]|uniref:Uncharacterized protein n=1 Tax=Cannabis sativa TaxID=3483 RepID=A0A7J6HGZ8_CANSA|nr:hypothetical protein G4B88_007775 [Cannabis sativa]
MARYRSRSRSYSPRRRSRTPPPRGSKRYEEEPRDSQRDRRDRRSPAPSGLLVRNLPLDASSSRHGGSNRRRTPPRSPRRRYNSYSRSPSPVSILRIANQMNGGRLAPGFSEVSLTCVGVGSFHPVVDKNYLDLVKNIELIVGQRMISSSKMEAIQKTLKRFRARDDYRSPVRSRSISCSPPRETKSYRRSPSHSPLPNDRDYRRSPSPRANGRSPSFERVPPPNRSRSPKVKTRSPSMSRSRSYSPR